MQRRAASRIPFGTRTKPEQAQGATRRRLAPIGMSGMSGTIRRIGALGLFGVAGLGCQGEPSFEVSWAIAQDYAGLDDAMTPESPAECTARGIDGVRIITSQLGVLVDDRRFDCYAGGSVAGPELASGSYDIEVLGLRRSQRPWACELPSDYIGDPGCTGARGCACNDDGSCDDRLSCAGRFDESGTELLERFCEPCIARERFQVEIDGSVPTIEAALIAPPECDDGLDNDGDGLTDALDPACTNNPDALESDDFTQTVVDLQVVFLGGNTAAECIPGSAQAAPLGVSLIRVEILDAQDQVVESNDVTCQRNLPIERFDLEDGDYRLEVTGYAIDGSTGDPVPRTLSKSFDFQVAGAGTFVTESIDFRGEDFLEPVTGSVRVSFAYDMGWDPTGSADLRFGCGPSGSNNQSPLVVDTLDVTIFDIDGQPVDPAAVGFTGATPSGDASRLACSAAPVISASLDWNSYSVSVEALTNGTVCLRSPAPDDMVPDFTRVTTLQRELVDGAPPAGCEDCSTDADCLSPSAPECVAGLCVPRP